MLRKYPFKKIIFSREILFATEIKIEKKNTFIYQTLLLKILSVYDLKAEKHIKIIH